METEVHEKCALEGVVGSGGGGVPKVGMEGSEL